MDVKHLNYFVTVADCESYSIASQKLYISQPAVSKAIKNIEEEMGLSLFYTHKKKQKLTDAGAAFYDRAVRLLESYEDLVNHTYMEEGIDKGHLRVGISVMAGPALFSHVFPKFKKEYPDITISLMEKETTALKEAIIKKDIDLAFIDLYHIKKEDEEIFDVKTLATSQIVLVCNHKSSLAKKKSVSYDDLDGQRMIMFNNGGEAVGQSQREMRSLGIHPEYVLSSSQWDFIFDMIGEGMGMALVPYYVYAKFENKNVIAVPMTKEYGQRSIGLIYAKEYYQTRAAHKFIEFAGTPAIYRDMKSLVMSE